ncbi:MAG: dephospho-CoA kinase [Gammaproteobacteria bacterium]|nr:dephospho-CoA kinase [Gammaproteobacteria bacterium]
MTLCIGLTGGIGSGKSTVANMFIEKGVPVIDMDVIAHQLVEPGQPALEKIVALFGKSVLLDDGQLDRKTLRELIFAKPSARQQLEQILHPRIRQEVQQQIKAVESPYCIIAIPLLFETNQQDLVQRILVVDSSEEHQIERTVKRDLCNAEQVKSIIHNQIDRATRVSQADDIIDNTSDQAYLQEQVDKLHQTYLDIARTKP